MLEDCFFFLSFFFIFQLSHLKYHNRDENIIIILIGLWKLGESHEAEAIRAIVYLLLGLATMNVKNISKAYLFVNFILSFVRKLFESEYSIRHNKGKIYKDLICQHMKMLYH